MSAVLKEDLPQSPWHGKMADWRENAIARAEAKEQERAQRRRIVLYTSFEQCPLARRYGWVSPIEDWCARNPAPELAATRPNPGIVMMSAPSHVRLAAARRVRGPAIPRGLLAAIFAEYDAAPRTASGRVRNGVMAQLVRKHGVPYNALAQQLSRRNRRAAHGAA